jgi:hypothetical protein
MSFHVEPPPGEETMSNVISGAETLREYEGPFLNKIVYRRRCDDCGYQPPSLLITVACVPGDPVMYGTGHKKSFVCSFCGNHQEIMVQWKPPLRSAGRH